MIFDINGFLSEDPEEIRFAEKDSCQGPGGVGGKKVICTCHGFVGRFARVCFDHELMQFVPTIRPSLLDGVILQRNPFGCCIYTFLFQEQRMH
jgi:hypothetical protein